MKAPAKSYLEIGPGEQFLEGFDTLDWPDSGKVCSYYARWGEEELPILDEQYDLVYASHVLEHIPWFKTIEALKEVFRILKPGGVLEVWVPDFEYLIKCYIEETCGDNWRKYNPDGNYMLWLNGRIFTYGPEPNWHKSVFDVPYLATCLMQAGFCAISSLSKPRGYNHGKINLGMKATKGNKLCR